MWLWTCLHAAIALREKSDDQNALMVNDMQNDKWYLLPNVRTAKGRIPGRARLHALSRLRTYPCTLDIAVQ